MGFCAPAFERRIGPVSLGILTEACGALRRNRRRTVRAGSRVSTRLTRLSLGRTRST